MNMTWMKIRWIYVYIVMLFVFIVPGKLAAQINDDHRLRLRLYEVALLDIEPGITSVSLETKPPEDAGAPLQEATDNSSWINYTSCVSPGSPGRTVSVELDGFLPSWLELQLEVSSYTGTGQGDLGSSVGTIILSGVTTDIITGIGGCYTGDGINNGHQLTYRLGVTDYSNLVSASYGPLLVTYTISD